MAMASSALATFRGSEQGSVNVALAKTRWTSYPYELEASRLKISVGLGWTQLLAANNKYWLMCKDEIIRRSRNSRSTDFHASHKFLVWHEGKARVTRARDGKSNAMACRSCDRSWIALPIVDDTCAGRFFFLAWPMGLSRMVLQALENDFRPS
jgi:hypothetical protein